MKDVEKEVSKAITDSIVYGTGIVKIDSDIKITHVPFLDLLKLNPEELDLLLNGCGKAVAKSKKDIKKK